MLWNGKDGFEVQEGEYRRFTVDLEKWTCSCRYWELSGLPCAHAISSIYTCGLKLDDFIADCYSINTYNQIYDHVLQPVEGKESWPVSDNPRPHRPVRVNNKPGRKKTERTREEQEKPKSSKISRKGVKMRCSVCGSTQHNKRKHSENPQDSSYVKAAKRSRKRTQAAGMAQES